MDDTHAALAAALAALDEARLAVAEAMIATAPRIPLKQAAHAIGTTESALRKRAQRGGVGFKIADEWYFSPDYVAAEKSRRVHLSGHRH